MIHMTAGRFRHLMRKHGWTIRTLGKSAGVTLDRVRWLREAGIRRGDKHAETASLAALCVWGWMEILTRRQESRAA